MTYQTVIHERDFQFTLEDSIQHLQNTCHGLSCEAGWWGEHARTEVGLASPTPQDVAEKMLLIHCELSEAVEGRRKDLMDDHLPHRKMFDVELADVAIRLFDLAGAMRIDLAGAIVEKMAYNTKRKDHQPENRALEGGKKF